MMPGLANSSALAMRRRHLRRRRIVRVATVAYHAAAAIGVAFIVALVFGLLPSGGRGIPNSIRSQS